MERPISVGEASRILGVSDVAILKRIANGTLVAHRLSGKGYLVSAESVRGKKVNKAEFSKACRQWVSVPEACEIVCVTDGMVIRMVGKGLLKGFRLNAKAWAISRESCEKNIAEYLANPNTGGRPRDLSARHSPKKRTRKTA